MCMYMMSSKSCGEESHSTFQEKMSLGQFGDLIYWIHVFNWQFLAPKNQYCSKQCYEENEWQGHFLFQFWWQCAREGRSYCIWIHLSSIRQTNLTLPGLVAGLSQIAWTKLIQLILMSNRLKLINFQLYSTSSYLCFMNEKYTCMQ